MDLDSNPRNIDTSKGNYPYAENVRCGFTESEQGRGTIGSVENMLGALLINNPDVPNNGRYVCIGATQDRMNNYLYYYVCDTTGDQHGIYRYNYLLGTITKVYKNHSLGFSRQHPITSSDVINSTLYWSDNFGENKQLYVPDAILGKYDSGLFEFSALGRKQPSFPIICSEPTVDVPNFTDTQSFQFMYRYVYLNGQKSRWSVPSQLYHTGFDSVPVNRKGIDIKIQNLETGNASVWSKIVAYIDVAFRNSDTSAYYLYKRFPFPTVDGSVITDTFLNDKAYPAVSQSETVLNYDNIPRKSKTVVIASNRHISANNTYGYDDPEFTITDVANPQIASPSLNRDYLNTGGRYGLCLLFYDWLGRCNGAIPLDGTIFGASVNGEIPSRNGAFLPYGIRFTLKGVCPEWVSYYRVGITKMRNKGKFVDVFVNVISSTTEKLEFSANFVSPTPSTITWIYTGANTALGAVADRASIKAAHTDGSACTHVFSDMPLTYDASSGSGVYTLSKKGVDLDIFTGKNPLIELFSPIQSAALGEPFFEIPDTYSPSRDSNGILRYGADGNGQEKIILIGDGYGDTRYRKYTGNTTMPIGIEAMSANDKYYETWQHNIGRLWVVPPVKPSEYTDTKNIAFSDPFIPNGNASTQAISLAVNGLNSYNPSNQQQLPVELGDIQKLIQATDYQINGSVLLCITSTDTISYYLEKTLIYGQNGNPVLGISDQFMNKGNLLMGNGGTLNPESVKAYNGRAYWWDVLKGIMWRYAQDGLTPISHQYLAKAYCNAIGASAVKNRDNPLQLCPAAFDPYFDEYIVYLNDISNQESKILAFNETKNGFSTFYNFKPEWMETVNQYVCLFKNGQLYVQRMGQPNIVFGEKLKSKIAFVSNELPWENKKFMSISVEAQDQWVPKNIRTQYNTRSNNPITFCKKDEVQEKEWDFWYTIKRDASDRSNSPLDLRGKFLYGELELDDVDYLTRLYSVGTTQAFSHIVKTP